MITRQIVEDIRKVEKFQEKVRIALYEQIIKLREADPDIEISHFTVTESEDISKNEFKVNIILKPKK